MMNPNLPYRHHEFHTPSVPPFSTARECLWPTLVGEILKPIIESKEMVYWFCFHGEDFQFCFAHQEFKEVEEALVKRVRDFKSSQKVQPTDGALVGSAFRGSRWMRSEGEADEGREESEIRRSSLTLGFLHATSALYLDKLRKDGDHWRLESNSDRENPLGNGFESLIHNNLKTVGER